MTIAQLIHELATAAQKSSRTATVMISRDGPGGAPIICDIAGISMGHAYGMAQTTPDGAPLIYIVERELDQ